MAVRFKKSKKIGKYGRINLSKSGGSALLLVSRVFGSVSAGWEDQAHCEHSRHGNL